MSIFRREGGQSNEPDVRPKPVQRAAPTPKPTTSASTRTTLVAGGSTVEGKIKGASEVLVEGVVDGEIDLESQLIIGEQGRVHGDVHARSVRISGRLIGNVTALDKVELMPSGSIEGDVVAPRVVIAEGGFCKGKIEMNPPQQKAQGSAPKKSDEGKTGSSVAASTSSS